MNYIFFIKKYFVKNGFVEWKKIIPIYIKIIIYINNK